MNMHQALAAIGDYMPKSPPMFQSPVGRRRCFMSASDADAYTREFFRYVPGSQCPTEYGPAHDGWRDAAEFHAEALEWPLR